MTELLSLVAGQTRDERAGADGAGICLRHARDALKLIRRDARADAAEARERVRRGRERVNAEVRVAHGAELTLEQDLLAGLQRVMQERARVGDVGRELVAPRVQLRHQLVRDEQRLVVQVLKEHVFERAYLLDARAERWLVVQLAQLDADLGVFVGIERRDARTGGAVGRAGQTLFLIRVLQDVVRHEQLHAVGNENVRGGDAAVRHVLQLGEKRVGIERDAVADDVRDVGIAHARRQQMQRKSAVVVDDGMPGVRAALEADDNIGIRGEHIGDLALALVAPVGADDCCYHRISS